MAAMTFKGSGVAKSDFLGFRLLTKATERGYPDAQADLGFLRLEESDLDAERALEALKRHRLAAGQGHPGAAYALGEMCKEGRGGAKDLEKAASSWTWLSIWVIPRAGKAPSSPIRARVCWLGKGLRLDFSRKRLGPARDFGVKLRFRVFWRKSRLDFRYFLILTGLKRLNLLTASPEFLSLVKPQERFRRRPLGKAPSWKFYLGSPFGEVFF